jgi:hypothetical protein
MYIPCISVSLRTAYTWDIHGISHVYTELEIGVPGRLRVRLGPGAAGSECHTAAEAAWLPRLRVPGWPGPGKAGGSPGLAACRAAGRGTQPPAVSAATMVRSASPVTPASLSPWPRGGRTGTITGPPPPSPTAPQRPSKFRLGPAPT